MSLATDLASLPLVVIFDAWFDPKAAGKCRFATPGGVSEQAKIDARVGGGFTIQERRGETLATHFGEYREIFRPKRIAFMWK